LYNILTQAEFPGWHETCCHLEKGYHRRPGKVQLPAPLNVALNMSLIWTRSVVVTKKSDADLAIELANRWLEATKAASWPGRLALLNEIHDHLREEIPEFDRFCDVFPRFIAELVNLLSDPVIRSSDQAHVFANSADASHRQAAAAWFKEQRDRNRL
jgi:hypothetical protein